MDNWTTHTEIEFLKGLGTHKDNYRHGKILGQKELLLRYQKNMPLRKNWASINKFEVMKVLEELINGS